MAVPQFTQLERHERAAARVGTSLCKKWRLDRLLGTGGMASVFAATHHNGSRVAIKMLHAELSDSLDIRERFLEEGYAANRVGPPGVVTVLDDGVAEDGSVFLVMELLDGQTLEQICSERRLLQFGEALRVADQVLSILERAHRNGVVHRDIKPENVFVTKSGEIRLLDFGIARISQSRRTHPTEIGSAMGTPVFMPPEQARGRWEAVDGRSDLWALGATLFWSLSGHFVHEAFTVNEELLLAMTEPARSLGTVLPTAPPEIVALVDRALAFAPEDRFPDATAMRQAVNAVRERLTLYEEYPTLVPGEDDSLPTAQAPEPPEPPSTGPLIATLRVPMRRPKLFLAIALAGAGVAAAAAIDGAMRERPSSALATEAPRPESELTATAPSTSPLSVEPEPPRPPATSVTVEERRRESSPHRLAPRRATPPPRRKATETPPPQAREPESAPPKAPATEGAASASEGSISIPKPPPSPLVRQKPPVSPDPLSRRK
jgi:serine/threonine protein kinase